MHLQQTCQLMQKPTEFMARDTKGCSIEVDCCANEKVPGAGSANLEICHGTLYAYPNWFSQLDFHFSILQLHPQPNRNILLL